MQSALTRIGTGGDLFSADWKLSFADAETFKKHVAVSL